jgi:uncharacterized membrane protein YecN with MAPEG domain
MGTILPITLVTAAALALINIWLTMRIGQVRQAEGVSVGDGGSDRLIRRMRAQANFVENAPFVLALVGLIEFSSGTSTWLWLASAAFIVARLLHPFGMDGTKYCRMIGTLVTMLLLVVLAGYAIFLAYHGDTPGRATPIDLAVPRA